MHIYYIGGCLFAIIASEYGKLITVYVTRGANAGKICIEMLVKLVNTGMKNKLVILVFISKDP